MSCKNHKAPRKLPYGATKGLFWCWGCDTALVPEWYGKKSKHIKRAERNKAKNNIRKELLEIDK